MTGARARAWLRAGLIFLAVVQGALGAWILLAPRSFYDNVPTVAMDPPFNEHLLRDFGAANVGITVMLGAGAIFMERRLIGTALVAYLAFAVPHLLFHAAHVAHYPVGEAVALTTSVAVVAAIPVALLFLVRRMGNAAPPG